MKKENKLYPIILASMTLLLVLIIFSSTESMATAQSTSPTAPYAYVTNAGSYNVSVIDTATETVIAMVNVGKTPEGVAISPDGTKIYVANCGSNTVSVINTTTNTVIATVKVGSSPVGVSVSLDGKKVYVANQESNTVSVIDTATETVTAMVN